MRKELKKINGVRDRFTMTFSRYGERTNWNGYSERTYLFKDIKDKDGKILTDHIWLKDGKRISALGELKDGDVIEFDARVEPYRKVAFRLDRYYQKTTDYTLKFPTNFKKVGRAKNPPSPTVQSNEKTDE